MAAGVVQGRGILVERLKNQLGTLVSSVEIGIRNNLSSSNVVAETTLAGLLNRIYGWELVNANAIKQNYPGIDLIDIGRNIAVQVTSTRTVEKVRHTLTEVGKQDAVYARLIVLVITNEAPTPGMKNCTVPEYSGSMEIWNIPDLLRAAMGLDADALSVIIEYMEKELGSVVAKVENLPYLELPFSSALQATGFVGREEELALIRDRFHDGDRLVVLTGLGGMGKTELAVRYGREHPGTVYFARFDTSFTRTLANMAQGIRPKLTDDELRLEEGILCKKVLTLLEKSGTQDLLIIDNADSETGTLVDLEKDSGYKKFCDLPLGLLLTTRSDYPRAIQVKPMPEEPLFQIFRNHGAELTETEMRDLIRAVNGHTLTVDLIARTLNGKGWRKVTAEMMLTALRKNDLRGQKYRKVATDYNQSTEHAQIYEHLSVVFDVSGISDVGKNVMRCATLLPEGGMGGELFGTSLREEEQDALELLLERGWLEIRNALLSIHPVIRLVCLTELEPTQTDCEAFLEKLWTQYDQTEYRLAHYSQMAELFALAFDRLGRSNATWLNRSGIIWNTLGQYQAIHDLYLPRLSELEQTLSPDSAELATAYNYYGISLEELGDYFSALTYSEKALAIRQKVLPENDPDTARSYHNVGVVLNFLGNHHKALEYKLSALEILECALDPKHPDLATSYDSVGFAYGALYDHRKALAYHQKALSIREEVLTPGHPDIATSFENYGFTCGELGDHQKALEYLLKALTIRERALPSDHPNLARSYNNIGHIYTSLGNDKKALEYEEKALMIRKRALPPNHPDLARSYNNVGAFHYDLGDHQKALEYQLNSLSIWERTLPPEHLDLGTVYNNVGNTYSASSNHQKALEYKQKALAILEKALPPGHSDLALTYSNTAWTYRKLGDFRKAAEYMRKAANSISRSSLPKKHPDRLEYTKLAEQFEVEARMQQGIEEMKKTPGWGQLPPPFIRK